MLPGVANLHSHAHHRGLVGYADRLASGSMATLWTWREVMYRHLLALDPDDLEAYATLAYIEMLRRGYTAVGEFHYLHHDRDGRRYADRAEMSDRIVAAARSFGDRAHAAAGAVHLGWGGRARPRRSSAASPLTWMSTWRCSPSWISAPRRIRWCESARRPTASAPSPRASSKRCSARGPTARSTFTRPSAPRRSPRSPPGSVRGRSSGCLAHTPIDERWSVIHATHMTASERQRLAGSGAVAGVCPLTEANLADGRFDLAEYRHDGGRLGVGTDANHLIDLPGELRMLEYGQRIVGHRRDSLLEDGETSVGAVLFGLAASGGAQALAQPIGGICPGLRCDLVELDPTHPSFAGQSPSTILDSWIFSTASDSLVRTVLIAGQPVIRDGHHPLERAARERVDAVMSKRHDAGSTSP